MRDRILREVPEKRERCVKHFQMTQKGMAAAVYPAPVHYEEDGQWKEIDNRLEAVQEDGREVYRNLASAVRVSFAKESDTKELVTIEKDGKKILWGLSPFLHTKSTRNVNCEGEISTFRVLEKEDFWKEAEMLDMKVSVLDEEESEEDEIRKMMCVPHLNGEGVYEEILPGIDLHYSIQGEQLKENIRLNRKEEAEQELSFQLTHPGMELRNEEDGGLGLYDSENQESGRIFRLVKPYMYDAAGNQSLQVEFQVEIGTESSVIKVVPDREWMQDTERVYPIVIDPMTETSKTKGNIEDTYVFTGGNVPENPGNVYAYGSFVVGRSDELGKMRALLRFRDLPDIGKGSIIYGATMYIWQFEYSSYSNPELPLLAYEVKNSWDEKSVRWGNQPAVDGAILDYKKVKQVINGNTVSITPIGFNVTRLVRQWYNTGKNYGIMVKSKYEDDENLANRAYARFYASDSPSISSEQFPSGVFYYRNVNGLEDYQSYHEQSAGRAGIGYTNDFTGNVVWSHLDVATEGGPMTTEIRHVYNSSEADTSSRMGYGWRLSSQQELKESGIKDYPYVYIDEDGTKHYFYKDTNDGNKLKDEDGMGLTITVTSSSEHDRYRTMETKDKVKYIFGQDGFLRFIEDLDGNSVKHQYGPNSAGNFLAYVTDAAGGTLNAVYSTDATYSRLTAIQDTKGREIRYGYDAQGNLTSITYPDGSKSQFTYDGSHKLLSVTNPDGYRVNYEYTNDFRVPRVSKVSETGQKNAPGQELKISYENGNTTIFEEPGLDGQMERPGDNKKTTWHFDNMGRPTDVLDADGFANNYSYYTSGMKNHKLSKDGSVQKTVYGLLRNPTFDPSHGDGGWYTCRMSDGKRGAITHADGYIGTKSAKLTKTELTSEEGICQDVHLSAGTYTLSAYVKTESLNPENQEQGAVVSVIRADRTRIMGERCIDYVERSADGSERKIRYYYDALNQLVREDNQKQNKTICYTYDVGGNMVRRDEYRYTENPVITEAPRKSDTFEYQTGGWRDQLRFYNGQAITYNAMGNPLQYLGMQMEWEKGHQLRHITGAGLDMYCMYNDSGKRIRKTVNGVTTDFYLDGSAILMQTSSDGSRIDFFYDDKGNVFAMKYQNEMYFYRKNLFGDILGILDSHGTELVKYEYNSWGKLLNLTDYSSNGLGRRNPFRFKGYYYDEELGMYYLNSRYYDPEVGRFISPDTTDILEVQDDLYDKNLYAYCDNNSVMRIDSSGAVWHLAVGAVVGVATQFVADVGIGLAAGSSFGEVISSLSLVDYAAAAIGGAIAASGIGFAGAVVANATLGGTTYLANCSYKGVKANKKDFIASTVIGGVAGAIGGSGANGKNMRGVYSRSKQVINATKSVRKQAMYKAKVTGIKQNITKSTGKTVLAGIVSNVSNFFRRWFTKSDA